MGLNTQGHILFITWSKPLDYWLKSRKDLAPGPSKGQVMTFTSLESPIRWEGEVRIQGVDKKRFFKSKMAIAKFSRLTGLDKCE